MPDLYRNKTGWIVSQDDDGLQRNRDECWFCGGALTGSGNSGNRRPEHIFPRWLAGSLVGHRSGFAVASRGHEGELTGSRPMTIQNAVAGNVCLGCNGGWMSDLEVASQDVVLRLAQGTTRPSALSPSERKLVASWITKTAFAAQAGSMGPVLIPVGHRRHMVKGWMPTIMVLIGKAPRNFGLCWKGEQRWSAAGTRTSPEEVSRLTSKSYKVVLGIGAVVACVAYWPGPFAELQFSSRQWVVLRQGPYRVGAYRDPRLVESHAPQGPEQMLFEALMGVRVLCP